MNSAELGRSQDGKSISQSHLFALEIPLKKLEALTLQNEILSSNMQFEMPGGY